MLVIQPLIQGLRGFNLYYRVYENQEGYLNLEIGKSLLKLGESDKIAGEIIFGNLLTKKEVIYTLKEETYEKKIISKSINDFDLAKIENLIDSCYHFKETHKVTDWK